jgi:hypothetical protein
MRTFAHEERTDRGEDAGEGRMERLESPGLTVNPFEPAGDVGRFVGGVAEDEAGGDYAQGCYGDEKGQRER